MYPFYPQVCLKTVKYISEKFHFSPQFSEMKEYMKPNLIFFIHNTYRKTSFFASFRSVRPRSLRLGFIAPKIHEKKTTSATWSQRLQLPWISIGIRLEAWTRRPLTCRTVCALQCKLRPQRVLPPSLAAGHLRVSSHLPLVDLMAAVPGKAYPGSVASVVLPLNF